MDIGAKISTLKKAEQYSKFRIDKAIADFVLKLISKEKCLEIIEAQITELEAIRAELDSI